MNKQEQKRKLRQVICGSCDGCAFCSCPQINRILEAGYINGADFVEWLKEEYGELFYIVGYAYREQVDLNKALQEYLKGE